MIKHIWSLICKKSIIDAETNNISIQEVLEHLDVEVKIKDDKANKEGIFIVPMDYEVISMWARDKVNDTFKGEEKITIVNPEGKESKSFNFKLEIPVGIKRLRSRFRIQGLGISTTGNYLFQIFIKEEKDKDFKLAAEVPLEVNFKKDLEANKNHNYN